MTMFWNEDRWNSWVSHTIPPQREGKIYVHEGIFMEKEDNLPNQAALKIITPQVYIRLDFLCREKIIELKTEVDKWLQDTDPEFGKKEIEGKAKEIQREGEELNDKV